MGVALGPSRVMRIICLVTGHVRDKAGSRGVRRYVADEWRDEALPVNAFLVEHSEGMCLFDTGQTAAASAADWFPRWHPFFRLARFELEPEDELAPQLRSFGVDPRQIRRVVLSHLHTDHVGGLHAFAGAQVLVSRLEWERATGLGGRIRGYLPQHWPPGLQPRLVDFDGDAVGPFPASYDIAGDGRLLLVPTPGHTPGHAALLVRDPDQSWLLAGDMAHTAAELEVAAPATAAWCEEEGITVLTSHDPAAPALVVPRSTPSNERGPHSRGGLEVDSSETTSSPSERYSEQ
jgi:N-acyl homoserine lactone hydrolase